MGATCSRRRQLEQEDSEGWLLLPIPSLEPLSGTEPLLPPRRVLEPLHRLLLVRAVHRVQWTNRKRQAWAYLGAWLNVHKHLKGSLVYTRVASLRARLSARLQKFRSKELFSHLIRINGELRYRSEVKAQKHT